MVQYPPLPDNASIRLLVLHPGDAEDDLKASFLVEDLDHPHCEYEALSYYWGPPLFPQRIQIDGSDYEITQTLYDAFVRLRFPDKNCVLWADAVSIDQNSNWEKNHQVQLMSRIYSQCSRCVIYLGPEADGSELLPEFFSHLLEWLLRDSRYTTPAFERGVINPLSNSVYGLPLHDDRRWTAIRAFLHRPWFRRLWIMQEFALPEDVVTICGHWVLDGILIPSIAHIFTTKIPIVAIFWDGSEDGDKELERATTALEYHLSIRLALGHPWKLFGPDITREASSGTFWEGHLQMYSLFRSTAYCNVTDPRDAFYGLIGLAADLDDDPSLLPDYTKSLTEIRTQFYAFFFRRGFGYQILSEASLCTSSDTSQPSWMTINQDRHRRLSPVQRVVNIVTEGDLDRCKSAVSLVSSRKVAVLGYMVDRIRSQTETCCGEDFKILDEIPAIFKDNPGPAEELRSSDPIPLSDPKILDAPTAESYRRTALRILCLDTTHEQEKPMTEAFLDLCETYIDIQMGTKELLDILPGRSSSTVAEIANECGKAVQALFWGSGDRFGSTVAGYYGMFPSVAEIGDQIFMIDGSARTFLVRHEPDTDTYLWLGEVYVHDFEKQAIDATSSKTPTRIVVR